MNPDNDQFDQAMDEESSTESFADLFNEQEPAETRKLNRGEKVDAVVVGISDEFIFLDVGTKSEGYLARKEVEDDEGNLTVKEGDTIKAYFLSSANHEKLFTLKLGKGSSVSAAHLEAAFESGIPVEGILEKEIKGGFEVKLSGNVRAFCPFSQTGLPRVEDTAEYIGMSLSFKIVEFSGNGRNIIVSHRRLMEEEREARRQELQEELQEGMTVKGTVSSIQKFGAFVDIGGIDGLIPISEISWVRVEDVNDYLSVGQEVEVTILKLDWENNRITLSLKQTEGNPWDTVKENFPIGSIHNGTVVRLAKFGAFVNLAPGIDGLAHISKLGAGRRINHPREVVEEGQVLEVQIEDIDLNEKRISLSVANSDADQQINEEETSFKEFVARKSTRSSGSGSMGSLGDLLKAKLDEKNK
jgi:small subunit ribosomal protein S1